jgi:hypothetical protein
MAEGGHAGDAPRRSSSALPFFNVALTNPPRVTYSRNAQRPREFEPRRRLPSTPPTGRQENKTMTPRRARGLLALAFLIALGFTAVHSVRVWREAAFWRAHRDEPIAGWMTVGFVAHSHHVPPHLLQIALGLAPHPPDHRPISAIARAQGRSEAEVAALLTAAIAVARMPPPPPPGAPPLPPPPAPPTPGTVAP